VHPVSLLCVGVASGIRIETRSIARQTAMVRIGSEAVARRVGICMENRGRLHHAGRKVDNEKLGIAHGRSFVQSPREGLHGPFVLIGFIPGIDQVCDGAVVLFIRLAGVDAFLSSILRLLG
jgi:hypothetical protein